MVKQASASRKCFSLKTAPITAKMPRLARSSSKSPIRFIALDVRTSPPLEASTITAIAIQSSSHFMLLLLHRGGRFPRMLRQRRTSRYPAYSKTDPQYSPPAPPFDVLLKHEFRNECDKHVTKGRGWQNVAQVSKGESRQIRSKENGETENPDQDPRIPNRSNDFLPVMQVYRPQLLHAMRQQRVPNAAEAHHCQQYQILPNVHQLIPGGYLDWSRFRFLRCTCWLRSGAHLFGYTVPLRAQLQERFGLTIKPFAFR